MSTFYTYLWLREDGTPFYVGKGSGNRAYEKRTHRLSPPPKDRILIQEFPDEASTFIAEEFLIRLYGREDLSEGCLLNLTDGGENPPLKKRGCKGPSDEARRKISETLKRKGIKPPSRLGCKASNETKKKQSISLMGHKQPPQSEEQRRCHVLRMKGKTYHKGFKNSDASKRKMSESAKARAQRVRTERGTYA